MENFEQGMYTAPLFMGEERSSVDSNQVSDRTSIPVYAVAFTSFIACLLALVNIG